MYRNLPKWHLLLLISLPCVAQTVSFQDLPRFGLQGKVSTLGFGVEAATAVSDRSNVRFGFNALDLNLDETKDGISYDATLSLRSFQATFDYYLYRGLHVSPGFVIYNGNKLDATASVPGGRSFSLGNATYYSDSKNPIQGTGSVTVRKAAPMLLLGIGNLLPRSGRHFTVNFDFGVVFQGSPAATLNLNGGTCDTSGQFCADISGNSDVQANIRAEQTKLNEDLEPFKYYPVLSLGFGWRF